MYILKQSESQLPTQIRNQDIKIVGHARYLMAILFPSISISIYRFAIINWDFYQKTNHRGDL